MNNPLVYVLIINWNGLAHLRECFDSLLENTYSNVRFLLIDNASTDDSVAFVQNAYGADPRVLMVSCATNLGWAGGNNVGIEKAIEAGAQYIFLLNNDTVTAPDALERLVEAAEQNPNIGALAPKMLMYDNPAILNSVGLDCSSVASSWDIGIGRLDAPRWNLERAVIGVSGGAAFYRTAALVKAGLLPPDFQIYFDDLDLSLRIWDAGYEIWTCPAAVVRHKYGATMGRGKQARRKYYLATRNRLRVILRNFPRKQLPKVLGQVAVGEARAVGRALVEGDLSRVWAHKRSWLSALFYLPRAIEERRRRAGRTGHGFWPLIRTNCRFFPGVEFPRDGWYAPRIVRGKRVQPISARAWMHVAGGKLRITYVNGYPEIGASSVEVFLNGHSVAKLETRDSGEAVFDVAPGTVELVSRRIFTAEETGELADIGGWVAVEDNSGP